MSRYADPVFPALFTSAVQQLRQFDRDLITALGNWSLNLKGILDRGISFQDNIDCRIVSLVTPVSADTGFTIAHGLGKVPTGVIVISKSGYYSLADFAAHDSTNLHLKSDGDGISFKVIVF